MLYINIIVEADALKRFFVVKEIGKDGLLPDTYTPFRHGMYETVAELKHPQILTTGGATVADKCDGAAGEVERGRERERNRERET